MSRRRGERGAATVLVLAAMTLLLLVALALSVVSGMLRAQRSAESAADLSALAGALAHQRGQPACARAAAIADAGAAVLEECWVEGAEVRVTVLVRGPRWLGHGGDLRGQARAGPARVPEVTGPDGTG